MLATKGQCGLALILAAGLVSGVARSQEPDEIKSPPADDALVTRVNQSVELWQPTGDERRLDQIGWVGSLGEAQRLAKEKGRPVFLFTYNGCATREHALALQRC
jgi:hypothetical protein